MGTLLQLHAVPVSSFFVAVWSVLGILCLVSCILSFRLRLNTFFKSCFILNTTICGTRIVAMAVRIGFITNRDAPSDSAYNFFFPVGMGLYFSMFILVTAEWGRIIAKMSSPGSEARTNKIINIVMFVIISIINIMTIVYVIVRLTSKDVGTSKVNSDYFIAFILIVSSLGILVLLVMIVFAHKVIQLVRATKTSDQIGAQVMARVTAMVFIYTVCLLARWIYYIWWSIDSTMTNTDAGAYVFNACNLGAEWLACVGTWAFCATTLHTAWKKSRELRAETY